MFSLLPVMCPPTINIYWLFAVCEVDIEISSLDTFVSLAIENM